MAAIKSKQQITREARKCFSLLHKMRRKQLGLTQREMAAMLGIGYKSLAAYEGAAFLPEDLDFYLDMIDDLEKQIHAKQYEKKVRGKSRKRPIVQVNAETGIVIRQYEGCGEAERITGIKRQNIFTAIKKGTKSGGYLWRYKKGLS